MDSAESLEWVNQLAAFLDEKEVDVFIEPTRIIHQRVFSVDEVVHRADLIAVRRPAAKNQREALAVAQRPNAVNGRRHPPVGEDLQ